MDVSKQDEEEEGSAAGPDQVPGGRPMTVAQGPPEEETARDHEE